MVSLLSVMPSDERLFFLFPFFFFLFSFLIFFLIFFKKKTPPFSLSALAWIFFYFVHTAFLYLTITYICGKDYYGVPS